MLHNAVTSLASMSYLRVDFAVCSTNRTALGACHVISFLLPRFPMSSILIATERLLRIESIPRWSERVSIYKGRRGYLTSRWHE